MILLDGQFSNHLDVVSMKHPFLMQGNYPMGMDYYDQQATIMAFNDFSSLGQRSCNLNVALEKNQTDDVNEDMIPDENVDI